MNAISRAALFVALCCSTSTAKEFESADKKVRVTVPDEWQPRETGDTTEQRPIRLAISLPGEVATYAAVANLHRGALTARAQAHMEAIAPFWKKFKHVEIRTEPAVHLVAHDAAHERFEVVFFKHIRGNPFSIWFGTTESTYKKHRSTFSAICQSIDTDLPAHPPVPEGFRKMESNGFLILIHETVKGKAAAIRRELAKGIKRFTALHGRPRLSGPAPPQILVTSNFSQRTDLRSSLSGRDFQADWRYKRLYCKRLGAKPKARQIAWFRRELHELLFGLTYGAAEPAWPFEGLGLIEQSHVSCGKRLPALAGYLYGELPRQIMDFSRMLALKDSEWKSYIKHGYGYSALFHAGPKKYRNALKDFLADLRETGDWRAAERSHILTFDQTKMKADAQKFLRKLKSVKGK